MKRIITPMVCLLCLLCFPLHISAASEGDVYAALRSIGVPEAYIGQAAGMLARGTSDGAGVYRGDGTYYSYADMVGYIYANQAMILEYCGVGQGAAAADGTEVAGTDVTGTTDSTATGTNAAGETPADSTDVTTTVTTTSTTVTTTTTAVTSHTTTTAAAETGEKSGGFGVLAGVGMIAAAIGGFAVLAFVMRKEK